MTKGKKQSTEQLVSNIENNDEIYGVFTEDFAKFLVNIYDKPFQTSLEEERMAATYYRIRKDSPDFEIERISKIDPDESKDVVDAKILYVKRTWEELAKNGYHLERFEAVKAFADYSTRAKNNEEQIGFERDDKGKFKFPDGFRTFLEEEIKSRKGREEVDLDKYWKNAKDGYKRNVVNKYLKNADLEGREEVLASYSFASQEGIARFKQKMSDASKGIGVFKEPSLYDNLVSGVSSMSNFVFDTTSRALNAVSQAVDTISGTTPSDESVVNKESSLKTNNFSQSHKPSASPTVMPTVRPSLRPTLYPSSEPSSQPSSRPTRNPTYHDNNPKWGLPSSQPSSQPSRQPSSQPSFQPVSFPTLSPNTSVTTNNSGLSAGAIAGIAIGVLGGASLIAYCNYKVNANKLKDKAKGYNNVQIEI